MDKQSNCSNSFVTIGGAATGLVRSNATGLLHGVLGSARPLPVSETLAELTPTETDSRLLAALERCSGQRPVLSTRLMLPENGPSYRVVDGIRWDVPPEAVEQLATVVEASFRAAPSNTLAAQLYRLRIMTRGRDERADADREAEATIWLEQLRCWPGDIALQVLATWTSRPNGQWWPTWNEVEKELRTLTQPRRALAQHLLRAPGQPLAIEQQKPAQEQRDRAVAHWENEVRPTLKQPPKPRSDEPPPGLTDDERRAWFERRLEALKAQPLPALSTEARRSLGLPDKQTEAA